MKPLDGGEGCMCAALSRQAMWQPQNRLSVSADKINTNQPTPHFGRDNTSCLFKRIWTRRRRFGARSSAFGHVFDRLSGCLHEKSIATSAKKCLLSRFGSDARFNEPAKALYTTTKRTKLFCDRPITVAINDHKQNHRIRSSGSAGLIAKSTYNVARRVESGKCTAFGQLKSLFLVCALVLALLRRNSLRR